MEPALCRVVGLFFSRVAYVVPRLSLSTGSDIRPGADVNRVLRQVQKVPSTTEANRDGLTSSGGEAHHNAHAAPKFNAVLVDQTFRDGDCRCVVHTNQRLKAIKMAVAPDEVRAIFFHRIGLLRRLKAGRVGPIIQMHRCLGLPELPKQLIPVGAMRHRGRFSAQTNSPLGNSILKGRLLFERTPFGHGALLSARVQTQLSQYATRAAR